MLCDTARAVFQRPREDLVDPMADTLVPSFTCPVPLTDYDRVLLGHGSGGKLSASLIGQLFLPAFANRYLSGLEDQARLELEGVRLAFTTDAFVVSPLFFPGGDIGRLAVNGTVNDLAVGGATPLFISAAFILEEGMPLEDLRRIAASMRAACDEAGVMLVAGDTKVVDRGKADGVFITTTGIGVIDPTVAISAAAARPGDRVLVSGTLGDHGIAILSVREGIEFETTLKSDTAPLASLVARLLEVAGPAVHCLRDPTRGGISSTLNELARASKVGIELDETAIPMRAEVRGACEMLGLDPLYVANEGKLVAIVSPEAADAALDAMRANPLGRQAAQIGQVVADHPPMVLLRSTVGGMRVVDMLSGEQLPRIC